MTDSIQPEAGIGTPTGNASSFTNVVFENLAG
jgi:hypothetical protein